MEQFTAWLNGEWGRGAKLAVALEITQGAISQWKQVPVDRVADVERFTGISRHVLRPDIFGPMPSTEGQAA